MVCDGGGDNEADENQAVIFPRGVPLFPAEPTTAQGDGCGKEEGDHSCKDISDEMTHK